MLYLYKCKAVMIILFGRIIVVSKHIDLKSHIQDMCNESSAPKPIAVIGTMVQSAKLTMTPVSREVCLLIRDIIPIIPAAAVVKIANHNNNDINIFNDIEYFCSMINSGISFKVSSWAICIKLLLYR